MADLSDEVDALLAVMDWRLERLEQDGGPVVLDNLSPPLPQYLAYYDLQAVIEKSRENLDAFRFLQALLKRLRPNFTTLADSLPDVQRPFFEEQLERLNSWARDVASGELPKPGRHPGRPPKTARNIVINETIQQLNDFAGLDYFSAEHKVALRVKGLKAEESARSIRRRSKPT